MNNLDILLNELNEWLILSDLEIELVVIGAYAVHLHGITSRMTMDVDTLVEIKNPEVKKKIEDIGNKFGIESWLNNQAEGLTLPDGFFDNTLSSEKFSHIKIQYACRQDLISLKVSAYFYRHENESKDLDDLILLRPNPEEFHIAASFLTQKHLPDSKAFHADFLKDASKVLDSLRNLIYG
jgi:hypothetical protein